MKFPQYIFIIYLIAINVIAYVLMWYDKFQSKNKGSRIPESKLFVVAFMLGAPGIYLGMKAPVYHKAAKVKFKWGIPFLILVNSIFTYCYFKYKITFLLVDFFAKG